MYSNIVDKNRYLSIVSKNLSCNFEDSQKFTNSLRKFNKLRRGDKMEVFDKKKKSILLLRLG